MSRAVRDVSRGFSSRNHRATNVTAVRDLSRLGANQTPTRDAHDEGHNQRVNRKDAHKRSASRISWHALRAKEVQLVRRPDVRGVGGRSSFLGCQLPRFHTHVGFCRREVMWLCRREVIWIYRREVMCRREPMWARGDVDLSARGDLDLSARSDVSARTDVGAK
jgi:hypothetical protein